jgi:hypothetical protein
MRRLSALCGAATLLAAVFASSALSDPPEPPGQPTDAIEQRFDRYQQKPAGTVETLNVFFGPYTIGPGQDMNRFDLDIPVRNGYILAVSPSLRKADDLTEYVHQIAHIHHAHWFRHDLGNLEDNYWDYPGFGTHEWIFGNGDEETKADFQPRTDADPNGPIYGQYIPADGVGPVIYMIHNKTSQPIVAYIRLKITFMHGTPEELTRSNRARSSGSPRSTARWSAPAATCTPAACTSWSRTAAPSSGPARDRPRVGASRSSTRRRSGTWRSSPRTSR